MTENEISSKLIGAAVEVHRQVGPGLTADFYEECLVHELEAAGLKVDRQVLIPTHYKGRRIEPGYRIGLLLEDCVIVEVTAGSADRSRLSRILACLKLAELKLGILIDFNHPKLMDGFRRVVNRL
ncbi:MAG TPA: GxxExxY protein [Flavobacterium sp.]|nr:GxxExxY protein [Flavobacterium sp.]